MNFIRPAARLGFSFSSPSLTKTVSRSICTTLVKNEKLPPVIDFAKFESLRASGSAALVDVRERDELQEHGAIPGAVNVPLGEVLQKKYS